MRPRRLFMAAALLAALAAPAAASAPVEIKRRVLALYKSSEGDAPARNLTASLLEQPLETLGLVVDYADADAPLPDANVMSRYRGVVTFFRGPVMTDARGYMNWLSRQAKDGRHVAVFGEIGALQDRASGAYLTHAELNRALAPLGFRYDGFGTDDATRTRLISAAPQMSFEEAFTPERLRSYERVMPVSGNTTSYLVIERIDNAAGESRPVLATTRGGYAGRNFILYEYEQGGLFKQRWHLDPFAFLTAALGLTDEPRFDAASLNGRRLWMAHIDGDGFLTPAGSGLLCGQVMLERILAVYRLPIAVSIVTGDLDRDPRALDMARAMFALPHVEPASHSASHPVDWTAPGVDFTAEIDGSLKTLAERTLAPGRKVTLMTWSGLCNPPAAALRRLSALGASAINGVNAEGGFVNRFDRLFPSRTHLAPMTRSVAGLTQFTHRASNDYNLTNGWAPDQRAGYEGIIETFERTSARPETPAHAYFHFYSAESPTSLRALESVMGWAKRNPVAPIFVSDYIRLVEDFRSASMSREADGRVIISNSGACRTVVFPDPERTVDFARSEGVLGFAARNNRLHVFLDGTRRHVVALSDGAPAAPSLVSAAGWVDRMAVSKGAIDLETRSFGDTEISVRVENAGSYAVRVTAANDAGDRRPFETSARTVDGRVTFTFPATGSDRVVIRPIGGAQAAARRAGFPLLALSLAAFPIWALVRTRRRLES